MKNLYSQVEDNEALILGSKDLNIEGVKVLKTDAPFIADKVMAYKHDLWNETMSFLGLNNANVNKKERLVTDEVNANNQMIELMAETMLLTRKKACEEINKMFGLNVSVELRNDISNSYDMEEGDDEWQNTQLN